MTYSFIVATEWNRYSDSPSLSVLLYVDDGLPRDEAESVGLSCDDFMCAEKPPGAGLWMWEGEGEMQDNPDSPEDPYWYPRNGTWRRPTEQEMGMALRWGESAFHRSTP